MAGSNKVTQGQPFRPPPAPLYNAIIDAGEQVLASRFNSGSPSPSRPRKTDIIKCKNGSGAARAKGEVLGAFTKSLTNLTAENIWLVGNAPAAGKAFGVYLKPAPSDDGYVDMQLSGVCLATVTISDTDHQFADIDPPNFKLVSAESGPVRIVYAPASTGDQECCVNLGGGESGVSLFRFTLTGAWSAGVADADIKEMDGTAVESSSVSDPEGIFSELESTDTGLCVKQGGTYYAIQAPC